MPGVLRTFSGSSVGNMWATSVADSSGEGVTHVYRFISSTWTAQHTPSLRDASIAVHSSTDIWLSGFTYRQETGGSVYSTAAHWNGHLWSRHTVIAAGGPYPAVTDARGGLWDGPRLHETGGKWYVPESAWIFGAGCQQAGFFGGLAGIPGTSATWAAGGCTPSGQHRVRASISVNGKL